MFDMLLGDNLASRKDFISKYGSRYLDAIDVSWSYESDFIHAGFYADYTENGTKRMRVRFFERYEQKWFLRSDILKKNSKKNDKKTSK